MSKDNMALIPAGGFEMGDHLDDIFDATTVHRVELDAFYMDHYQVTVGKFREFVDANVVMISTTTAGTMSSSIHSPMTIR